MFSTSGLRMYGQVKPMDETAEQSGNEYKHVLATSTGSRRLVGI